MSNQKKRGRKLKPHVTADGKHIDGLRRRENDGRWVITQPGPHRGKMFAEADETRAVERFRQLTGSGDEDPGNYYKHQQAQQQGVIDWRAVAREILTRPKWVAEQTGIEQIGYFRNIKPPEPSTSVETITETWKLATVSKKQRAKVQAAWEDFAAVTKIRTLEDITAEIVVNFRDVVYGRENCNGKTQAHLFGNVKRILRFAKSRAVAMKEIADALNNLSLLAPNETTQTIDPQPIERGDWDKLLAAADGDNKAMVLLMLNSAMYLQEVVRVRWEDIDAKQSCLITHRQKKGKVVRIAALWKETLDALSKVERKGDFVFYSNEGNPLTVSGAGKRFRKLRTEAKVTADVKAENIRDGAITAAAQENIEERLCKLLEGHRTHGVTDKYAKRHPRMVAPVCEAIHRAYLG